MYDIIDKIYVETVNLSCLPLFLLLSIYNIHEKKFYKDFWSQKSRTNYST